MKLPENNQPCQTCPYFDPEGLPDGGYCKVYETIVETNWSHGQARGQLVQPHMLGEDAVNEREEMWLNESEVTVPTPEPEGGIQDFPTREEQATATMQQALGLPVTGKRKRLQIIDPRKEEESFDVGPGANLQIFDQQGNYVETKRVHLNEAKPLSHPNVRPFYTFTEIAASLIEYFDHAEFPNALVTSLVKTEVIAIETVAATTEYLVRLAWHADRDVGWYTQASILAKILAENPKGKFPRKVSLHIDYEGDCLAIRLEVRVWVVRFQDPASLMITGRQ